MPFWNAPTIRAISWDTSMTPVISTPVGPLFVHPVESKSSSWVTTQLFRMSGATSDQMPLRFQKEFQKASPP